MYLHKIPRNDQVLWMLLHYFDEFYRYNFFFFKDHMDIANAEKTSIHFTTVMILHKDTRMGLEQVKASACLELQSGLIIVKILPWLLTFLKANLPIGRTNIFNMTIMEGKIS